MIGTGPEIAGRIAKGSDTDPFSPAAAIHDRHRCAWTTVGLPGWRGRLVLLNMVGAGIWLATNTGLISGVQAFDPYGGASPSRSGPWRLSSAGRSGGYGQPVRLCWMPA
jgi:hypothetical protein